MSYPTFESLYNNGAVAAQTTPMAAPQGAAGIAPPAQADEMGGMENPWAGVRQPGIDQPSGYEEPIDAWSKLLGQAQAPPAMSGGKV